jgi:preprotein translocase SecE subunit
MNFASKIVSIAFGLDLSSGYATIFLLFVVFCVAFLVWMIYYATAKKALVELSNVSWLSFKDTFKYTGVTVLAITLFSTVLFIYDLGLDKIVNVILNNAK